MTTIFFACPLLNTVGMALRLAVKALRTPSIADEEMCHCSTINSLCRRIFLAQHLCLECSPIVEETIGCDVFALLILFQDGSQPLCRSLTGLASLLVTLQHALPNSSLQVTLLVVVGIFPIHRASQALLLDVGTLHGNRPRTLKADGQLAVLINEERCLRCVAPHLCLSVLVAVAILHIHAALASTIEGHAQHYLLVWYSCFAMRFHSIRSTKPAHNLRAIEGGVMLGCVAHIVGHDVDHIEVLLAALEVDVLCAAHAGQSEPELLAQSLSEVAHQQGEVLRVVWRSADAGTVLCGIFPVDVNAVQPQLIAHSATIFGEGFAIRFVPCHLAEATTAPATNAEHDAQLGLLLLEGHYVAKPLFVINADTVELLIDMSERIVDVRHHRRIGHHPRPRRHIRHHHRLSLLGKSPNPAAQNDKQYKQILHRTEL